MKLFGWMRHKFRENAKEPLKDARIGKNCFCFPAHSSLDDQGIYPTSCAGSRYNSGSIRQINKPRENHYPGCIRKTEENFEHETISELFHGFLAIGTLGSEPALNEPVTPTFGMSVGDPTEENAELTENNLKLIGDELEKFLEAEAEAEAEAEEGSNHSPGRNSDTTTIASVIKPLEGANPEEDGKIAIFPLQGYLFGSSIELPETEIGVKKEKASLGELFQRSKIKDINSEDKLGNTQMQSNPNQRSAKNLIKKLLKKLHSSPKSFATGKTDSASTKKKFQKISQIFHRKVHPENTIFGRHINNEMVQEENNKPICVGLMSKKRSTSNETSKRWIQSETNRSGSAGNGEHWIKTDADYFVLEL